MGDDLITTLPSVARPTTVCSRAACGSSPMARGKPTRRCFSLWTLTTSILREAVARYRASALDGAWTPAHDGWLMQINDTGRWDQNSAENLSMVAA